MVFRVDRELTLPVKPVENVTYSFDTSIIRSDGKHERRRPKNIEPIATFQLDSFVLRQEEVELLWSFYQASRGTIDTFLYQSTVENTVTALGVDASFDENYTLKEIGKGVRVEGTTDQFYLIRSFEYRFTPQASFFASRTGILPADHLDERDMCKTGLRCPFVSVDNLYFDGVLESPNDYEIDAFGVVTSLTTDITNVEITWDGTYKFPVRFQSEGLEFNRTGFDQYQVDGLVLIQERLDDRLHDLTGNNYYVATDFASPNAKLELSFLPQESLAYNMPFLGGKLDNKIENRTAFYEGTQEKVRIDTNIITEKEKNYLRNFFMVMKGRLNSFFYQSEPKRYSSDSFSIAVESGVDPTNTDSPQYYRYSAFELEGLFSMPLSVTVKTTIIGYVHISAQSKFSEIEEAWDKFRLSVNASYFNPAGMGGSILTLGSGTDRYLQLYDNERASNSLDVVVIYFVGDQVSDYYSGIGKRSESKLAYEPASLWLADIGVHENRWHPQDSLIICQVNPSESTSDIELGQYLVDQVRDAVRNRSVYSEDGLYLKGGQMVKLMNQFIVDADYEKLFFGELLEQERRTEAIIMRIQSPELVTYTNTLSLANAVNNPSVAAGLQTAASLANLAATAGMTVTGGLSGGIFGATTGGSKVYLYDRINLQALEVVAIPSSPSTQPTPGQCPGIQYQILVEWFRSPSGDPLPSSTVTKFYYGPIQVAQVENLTQTFFGAPPQWSYDLNIQAFDINGQPDSEYSSNTVTAVFGDSDPTHTITISRVDLMPDDCGELPPFDVENDLQELGSQEAVSASMVGTLLPSSVFLVDYDTGEIYSFVTSIAGQKFFEFNFSTLDAKIRLLDGSEYLGQYAISSLATNHQINLSTDNQSIDSVFNPLNPLTPNKIQAGLLAGAIAEIYSVDWFNVPNTITDGEPLLSGVVGKTKFDENGYTFEIRSVGEQLNRPITFKASPKCHFVFGGPECGLDLVTLGFQEDTNVSAFDLGLKQITLTTAPLTANYIGGTVLLFSGMNAGLRLTITDVLGGNILEFSGRLVEPLYAGQGLRVTAFCLKDQDTCLNDYNNYARFGGIPNGGNFLPGLNVITVN